MEWAAKEGVVPLTAYPYTPHTGDCQGAFDSRTVSFAGAQVVDLSKPDNILQVIAWAEPRPACPSAPLASSHLGASQPPAGLLLAHHPSTHHPSTSAHPLLQALAKGPLAITIWADSNPDIQLYSTGIYTPPASSSAKEDHAVTLVGYGTETLASGTQADYWIIKNRSASDWTPGCTPHAMCVLRQS